LLGVRRCRAPAVLFWNWLLVQSACPAEVSPVSVKRSHFAVGLFLGFVVFLAAGRAGDRSDYQPSPSRRVPPSSRVFTTIPSRCDSVEYRLLSWASVPYSTCRLEGPLQAGMPSRYVPSSGFGYPRDGSLPSDPCRFCFAPAALLGFTLRSSALERFSRCFHRKGTHIPFGLAVFPPPKRRAGPRGSGFWVSPLPRAPIEWAGV